MGIEDGTRRSHRIRTWFETHFSSQRREGEGVLTDISYTGARLEDTSIQPHIGAHTVLYVSLPDDAKPFQVEGKVARHTDTGFAIDYKDHDASIREGVDRVSRLVEPALETSNEAEATPPEDDDADLTVTRPRLEDVQDPGVEAVHEPGVEVVHDAGVEAVHDPGVEKVQGPREIDLASHSLPELEALAERIATEIVTRRDEAKQRVREQISTLAQREGFSLDELLEARGEGGSES